MTTDNDSPSPNLDGPRDKWSGVVGAIDIGSNTLRLQLADASLAADGALSLRVRARKMEITRLAEGVDRRGILLPAAIARTRNALAAFNQVARAHGAAYVLCVATSAVRDADNGEAFLGEIEYGYGFTTELLSGSDEAQLTYHGVSTDPAFARMGPQDTTLLIDIGGGSTEVVLAQNGHITDHHSFQIGSVRLTERALPSDDVISGEAVERARSTVKELVANRFPTPPAVARAIGVAGTVTTAATLELGLAKYDRAKIHGASITRAGLAQTITRLAQLDGAARREVPGLEAKRAPVIVAGLVILEAVMDHFLLPEITASERDILDGAIRRAARQAADKRLVELPHPDGRTAC